MEKADPPKFRLNARTAQLSIVVVGFAMSLPYAIAGPGFFLDDWFTLRGARIDGWISAAGAEQWAARPGAGVVYALSFGLVHDRPLVHFVLLMALVIVAAVLLFRIVSRRLGIHAGLLVAMVWLLAPNHTSLEMWPSALNITLALVLVLVGIDLLERDTTPPWVPAALMAIGTLTYEAVAPLAVVVVLSIGVERHRAGRPAVGLLAWVVGSQVAAAAWLVLNWHPGKQGVDRWLSPELVAPAHIGRSVFGSEGIGTVAVALVVVALAGVMARRILRGSFVDARTGPLLAAGFAVVLLGTAPFVRYFYAPTGFGDRVTVVSGVGGAALLVALALEARATVPVVASAGIALCVVAGLAWRVEMTRTYITAAEDGRRVLEVVAEEYPEPPEKPLVFGPEPVLRHNVGPFLQFDWPLQWLYGTRDVEVETTYDESEFEEAGSDGVIRIDLRDLYRLEPSSNAP